MDPLTLALLGTGGAQAVGGGIGTITQYLAAQRQLQAQKDAERSITDAYGQAQGYQQPYQQAGIEGLGRMMRGDYETAIPQYQQGEMPGPYQAEQFNYQEDPGMAYRMQQGQRAVETGAAAQGTGLSGATLKALAKYGSELGSQEYGNAYSRYNQNRAAGLAGYQTNLGRAQDIRDTGWGANKDIYMMGAEQANRRYGRAQDLGTMGQTAATNMSNLASDYGQNLAGLYGARGNILAGQTQGIGQTVGTTLGNIANTGLDYMTMRGLGLGMNRPQTGQQAFNKNIGRYLPQSVR